MTLEDQLRTALKDAGTRIDPEAGHVIRPIRPTRRPVIAFAGGVGAVLVAGLAALWLVGGQGGSGPAVTGVEITATTLASAAPTTTVDVAPLPALAVDLKEAIAPYDHPSYASSLLVEQRISGSQSDQIEACLTERGITERPPVVQPISPVEEMSPANLLFPNLEYLREAGFQVHPGYPSGPWDDWQPSEETVAATTACVQELEASNHPAQRAYELWSPLMVEWYEIIRRVDEEKGVVAELQHFSTCLQESGIDVQYTDSLGSFLGYTDFLLADASGADEIASVSVRMGQLYARCATPYFDARETLLTGRLRTDFLDTHDSELSALEDLINKLD